MSVSIIFKLTGNKKGDIRIAFDTNDGSWSYVGTDLLSYPENEPTMNFGWLKPATEDEEYQIVGIVNAAELMYF